MPEHEEALVLKTEPSGESFLKLHLLTEEQGIFLCLKRISKKAGPSAAPDIFDTALVILENSKQGSLRFVKEYQLVKRRESIGQNYRSLHGASTFARLLIRNGAHMPESPVLFDLTRRTLDAFAEDKAPEIVLLKSLYLLLKDEGYPVRESWWPELPPSWREPARALLRQPTPAKTDRETREFCEHLEQHLTRWMRHHTDLIPGE
jgi:recombinational DNA repair protein (RecF pathway)